MRGNTQVSKLKRILIVGGGSSGWMTAALLGKTLRDTEVALVEASDIPIIGVGESTNMTMNFFLSELGVDEKEFMQASDAAFKLAIRFANFDRVGGAFFHPLAHPLVRPRSPDIEAAVHEGLRPPQRMFEPDADAFFSASEAGGGTVFSPDFFYSYQIDAGLFGEYLKKLCKRRFNVQHTIAEVEGTELTDAGEIACVRTRQAGALVADLYVDCTGFRSMLMGKGLAEPFESSGHLLLNDRAIAARVPYLDKEKELVTYTNCTALSSGWVWSIPLWSRLGTGYVYSSAFASEEQAEEELRQYLGRERVRDLKFNHLKIRVGRHARAWVGNCVAIGISYGFLEPLESTGLSLTQVAIRDLALALQSGTSLGYEREMYNQRQRGLFDSTRDFILAHYVITARDDTPYWKRIRNDLALPEGLVAALAGARYGSYDALASPHAFYRPPNWDVILSGMGYFGPSRKPRGAKAAASPSSGRNHAAFLTDEIFQGGPEPRPRPGTYDPSAHPTWYPIWSAD
jgi:tryptophan 6-halogenase